MPENTASRIVDYLDKHRTATPAELAASLSVTGADIRYHLGRLLARGQVIVSMRRTAGRGRPVGVYSRPAAESAIAYREVVGALLSGPLMGATEVERDSALRTLSSRLAGAASGTTQPQRLSQTVERLNSLQYQARWEAGPQGARIILNNCPFAGLIEAHPELCILDRYLLQSRSGLSARQLGKLQPGRDGLPRCIFVLG
jgi:predicted ArsR family transcriptional regulator